MMFFTTAIIQTEMLQDFFLTTNAVRGSTVVNVLFLNTLLQIYNITKIFNKQGNNWHQTKYNLSQKYNKCPTIYNNNYNNLYNNNLFLIIIYIIIIIIYNNNNNNNNNL